MRGKSNIYLSRSKIEKLQRKNLEDKFMDIQDEVIKKTQEIERLKDKQRENERDQRNERVNNEAHQPSSKKPEWDKDGNLKPKKRKKKKKKRGGLRKGAGNKKKELEPTEVNEAPLDFCPECGEDLQGQPIVESPSRIVEDIPENQKPVVSEEQTERKWCPICQKIVSSKSEHALPGSDYGLNVVALCAYFWVVTAMSLPNISRFFKNFFSMVISTSGISKMMIRLSNILAPIYQEILMDVKSGTCLWADETGWKINGQLHWMWAFANKYSAYYWIDRSRGGDVVNRILGEFFAGVLITDAWAAYKSIVGDKQTCMSHIFRKVRKYIEINPNLRSLFKFYLKLRRILKDAEKLRSIRSDLDELTFRRRLKKLKKRLSALLKWKNPNQVLKEVIDKVKRQENYILTFVEYEKAESHNNFAEGIIRKGVLKRKVSGGSVSLDGAKAYCIILSIYQTCHLRELSFFGFLKTSLVDYIRTGEPMSLAQYEMEFGQISEKAS